MNDILISDFLKFFIPLIGGVFAWFINERRKRNWEEYQRKESNYKILISSLRGFYTSSSNSDEAKKLKSEFLLQLDICWLYCPDEVIKKAYLFLNTVHTSNKCSDEEKENALGAFIVSIRNDLIKRNFTRKTKLKESDFKILTAT